MQNCMVILLMPLIFFVSLNGMMQPQNKKIFLSPSMQVVQCLINTVDLDHTMVCSLALNKQTEIWLKEMAPRRKEYLRKHITEKDDSFLQDTSATWHKYGSACGRKISNDLETSSSMMLQVYYMQQNISVEQIGWYISEKNVLRDNNLFFNEDGNVCCYGLEAVHSSKILYLGKDQHVVQYCLPQNGLAYEEMLGLEISSDCCRPLSQFISFPVLLNALIQTKRTKGGDFKLCNINDVIIPNDYKTCNPCDEYKKFEDLPKGVQYVFDNRYKQQSPFHLLTSMIRVYTWRHNKQYL